MTDRKSKRTRQKTKQKRKYGRRKDAELGHFE